MPNSRGFETFTIDELRRALVNIPIPSDRKDDIVTACMHLRLKRIADADPIKLLDEPRKL